jgi:hypothetical protein
VLIVLPPGFPPNPSVDREGTVKANGFSRLVTNFIMIWTGERERIWRFSTFFKAKYC